MLFLFYNSIKRYVNLSYIFATVIVALGLLLPSTFGQHILANVFGTESRPSESDA